MAIQKLQETKVFVEESWEELQKVTWPDYEQLRSATIVVVIFCVLVSATIWLMDVTVSQILDVIMGIFGA